MYSWKDRLTDWANQRGAWTHILVAVGVTLLITTVILAAAMPSKGVVNANVVGIGKVQTTIGTIADGLAKKATRTEFDDLSEVVTDALDDRVGNITGLVSRMNTTEAKLDEARTDITAIQDSLAGLVCSPPEAYLTGTFGDYILHAKSSDAGYFTANVHLVYSAPIHTGNTTTHDEILSAFYSGIIWVETTPSYAAVATFNGTAWGISEVWWNVGTFELAANDETVMDISCAWLNSAWEPNFAYVEVWPILK